MKLDIRYADKNDLVFIDYLQKKNAEDLALDKKQNSMLRGKALLDYRKSILEEAELND